MWFMCSSLSRSFKQEMSLQQVYKLHNKVSHTSDMLTFDNDVFVFNLEDFVAYLSRIFHSFTKINEFVFIFFVPFFICCIKNLSLVGEEIYFLVKVALQFNFKCMLMKKMHIQTTSIFNKIKCSTISNSITTSVVYHHILT